MAFRSLLACAIGGGFAACSFPDYAVERDTTSVLANICSDGLVSAAETDVDCGGGCPPCREAQACKEPSDCLTLACREGLCRAATCDDGVKNGSESDRDCGGQCQGLCADGRDCGAAADCVSRVCTDGSCRAAACNDEERNGNETGVDCGGSCSPCGSGDECIVDGDCVSRNCVQRLCVDPQCTDGALNGDETGVDCGGPQCGPCAPGEACRRPEDCASLNCVALECADAHCDDEVLNGDETDLDCGGATCTGCRELQACKVGADCQSGVCQSERCVPAKPTGEPIATDGWTGRASHTFAGDTPSDVFDGEPASIWSTGTVQQPGMFFEVDLGKARAFYSVDIECSVASDAPARFDIYLWQSGEPGAPARTRIAGFPKTSIQFATPQVARYIRLTLAEAKNNWWCLGELSVRQ